MCYNPKNMIRKVIEAGEPRLKAQNKFIKNIKSATVKKLIKDLSDTMYKTDLIGIAGPQVGENWQIFVTHPRSTNARKSTRSDKLRIFINPQIVFKSKAQNLIYEGCGSLADIFGPVLRPKEITIEAFDENGQKFSLTCNGILSRVIQHEYDHLQQTEFIQKVSDYNKVIVKKHYRKNIRNSKLQTENSKTTKLEFKPL
jgi:peptide deformylase